MTTAAAERDTHTPAWAVVVLGLLLLPLAALGFALSFQMMLPVMVIAGWSVGIAWGGPVLVDLAAASGALMQMVSRDRGIRWWGTGVLAFSTLLSIAMNLAGHSIERDGHALPAEYAGMRLGVGWQWVVILMSIATPLFIAVLVHAFGHVLMAYLASRSRSIAPTVIESIASSAGSIPDPVRAPIDPIAPSTTPPDRPSIPTPDPIGSTSIDPSSTAPIEGRSADLDRVGDQQGSRSIGQDQSARSIPDPTLDRPRSDRLDRGSDQIRSTLDPQARSTSTEGVDRPPARTIEELRIELREAIDTCRIDPDPSVESIRKTLRIAPARARELKAWLTGSTPVGASSDRHGLRVVGLGD